MFSERESVVFSPLTESRENADKKKSLKDFLSPVAALKKISNAFKTFFTDPITRPTPAVYLGFVVCAFLTATLVAYSNYYQFLHEKEEFSSSLQDFAREFKERRSAYFGVLERQAALFSSGDQTTNLESWRHYIKTILDSTLHSGFKGFAYIEFSQKSSPPSDPSLKPQSFAVLKFVYDVSSSQKTFASLDLVEGKNLFEERPYQEALLKSQARRKPIGVGVSPTTLSSPQGSVSQLLIFLPVSERDRFVGWVMGVVDLHSFLEGLISEDMVAHLFDRSQGIDPSLEQLPASPLRHHEKLTLFDYTWDVILQPTNEEGHLFYRLSSYLIPIIGLLFSVSVAIILWSQTTTRRRAQAMADRMSLDLRASEYKNRTIVENVPGAIFRCSPRLNWEMEFMSDAIMEIAGIASQEFTSKRQTLGDLLFEEDILHVEQTVGFVPVPGHSYDVEYRIRHADGRLRWVSERGRVITNEETGVSYLMGTIFDITDRKNQDRDLRNLTTALQNAVEGIAFLNADFEYERANESYLKTFGEKEEALLKTLWFDRLVEEDKKKAQDLCHDQRFEDRFLMEVRAHHSDGSVRHVHAVFVPSMNEAEERNGYYCFIRDVTERIQKEETLAFAMEEAKEANRTKSEFLATMSHELRTPLNAIIGYSEILIEEAEDAALETMSGDLQKINTAGRHLLELINDILDVSKLEAGKMTIHLEKFDIYQVVCNIRDLMAPTVSKNHNEIILDCDEDIGEMYSDFTKVRQGLFNLVSNATKFTEKGTIQIRVREKKIKRREFIVFEVEDSGCGISSAQLKKLFQPFTQADSSTTRKYGGTGLGLTITKRFCQILEGDVSVDSEYGVGSTFKILLPRITRHDLAEKLGQKEAS